MEPTYTPPLQQASTDTPKAANHKRTAIILWLMIGPTALFIGTLLLYGVVNFALIATAPELIENGGDPFSEPNPVRTVINIILFTIGAASTAAWLPGLIIGIILLVTGKK